MSAHIVIVSGIPIINNPRVVKEANALSNAGYNVSVIAAIYDQPSNLSIQALLNKVNWTHIPIIDLSQALFFPKLIFFYARLKRKIMFELKKKTGWELPAQLGYFVKKIYRKALSLNADLYIIHLEQALWVGQKLIQQGKNVAFDVEDWYSEDGLIKDRRLKPESLIKAYEKTLLLKSCYTTTTSIALSQTLANTYQCQPPQVIYNSFPCQDREKIDHLNIDRKDLVTPSIFWFSQTIGPGRGLEQLVSALQTITLPFQLHLRGTLRSGYKKVLLANLPTSLQKNIHFHPQVPQHELLSRISEHDIGYCGELSDCYSRDLTITNKILEYLRAGLAIIASDTSGHQEVAKLAPQAVSVFPQKSTLILATTLNELIMNPERLQKAKLASIQAIETTFSWKNSEEKLISLAKNALSSS